MTIQWAGALMVIVGCGTVGFSMAARYARDVSILQQLCGILNEMEWELQYHLTPLPDLCRLSASNASGVIRDVLIHLGRDLSLREHSDVKSTMESVLLRCNVPRRIQRHLINLGASLGRYDLHGQIRGLRSVKSLCRKELNDLEKERYERVRGYQTLALCAGAAIAIILI